MSIDATGMFFIPGCSWHRAQRRPSDGFKIGWVVVEESAIGFRIAWLLGFLKTTVSRVRDLHEY